jgi:hypothetical protein
MDAKDFAKDLHRLINHNKDLADSNGYFVGAREKSPDASDQNQFLADVVDSSGSVSTFRIRVTKVRIDTTNDPDLYGSLPE